MKCFLAPAVFFLLILPLLSEEGKKIASLSPNLTEMVFLLGKGDCLVGRSSFCDAPPEAKKIRVVGSFGKPFPEPLIASGAKIVITSTVRAKAVPEMLEKAGIRLVVIPDSSFKQYFAALELLGKLLDCRSRAQLEIQKAKKELEQLRRDTDRIPREKRPSVLVLISLSPPVTAGKKSFINEMIQLAGGRNVAEQVNQDYFTCSPEWIYLNQPDLIILCRMDGEKAAENLKQISLFSRLKAVRNNRVLQDLDPSLLYRLGPRTFLGIRWMNHFFFPENPH